MMKQWLLAAVSIILTTILPAQNISSTFDTNDEGWTAVNRVIFLGLPIISTNPLTYSSTGGNTNGCISINENPSFPGTLYFVAPPKFRGNKTLAYGNKLSFDIRSQRDPVFVTFVEDDLILEGNGTTLYFNLFVNNITNKITDWAHFDVPMNESAWLIGSRNGPNKPTKAQFQSVLCNITRFLIRSEYVTGADEGFLDNVTLEMTPRCYSTTLTAKTICSSQLPYTFNGKTYNAAGIYPDTFKNPCTLLCDSIVRLNLKVVNALTNRIDTTICSGQSIKVGNKTYTESIFFNETLKTASGCDSVITVNLTVLPPLGIEQNVTICKGDTLRVGSKKYAQSGNYTDIFKSVSGCDSTVITNLIVLAPVQASRNSTICEGSLIKIGNNVYTKAGIYKDTVQYTSGCDSLITTTTLTVNPILKKSQNLTICKGSSITVGIKTYNQSGVFVDTLKNANGCDSVVTTTLLVNPVSVKSQSFTICQGGSITVGNSIYTQAGVYTDILKNFTNCDSTITTTIIVNPISIKNQTLTICPSGFVTVGTKTYNKAGVFIDTLKNFTNCDSIVTTTLIVNPISVKAQTLTICPSGSVTVGSKTYNRAGVFVDTLKNFTNCDSIITTTLIVNPISVKSQNLTVCQGSFITVGNKTYNRTGVFVDTLKNFNNCDSVVTTTLTVSPPLSKIQTLSICQGEGVTVGNKTYNQTGVYKDTLTTATGCDSLVTTNLTVNPRYERTQNVAICPTGSFSINNNVYTKAGTYRDVFRTFQGCDSVITTILEVKTSATVSQTIALCSGQSLKVGSKNYTQTGIYRDTFVTVSGCDSIVISNLTINLPSAKSQTLKICQGDVVNVGNKTYTQSGVFRDTLKSFTNCDSIITTNLTVIPPLSNSRTLSICQGDFIEMGAKRYTQTGIFKDTLNAVSGCDSIVTLNLTVSPVYSKTQSYAVCEGGFVKVGGKTYNQTGIFADTFKTVNGCDSILITNLTVNKAYKNTQILNICNGDFIKVGTKNYSKTGIFTDTLKTLAGCDSIVITNLTVKSFISISQNLDICQGDFIKIGTKTYNQTGIFKDTLKSISGCDSVVTTILRVNTRYNRTQTVTICPTSSYTINFNTYTKAGTYIDTLFTAKHCDSVVTTILSLQNIVTSTQNLSFCIGNSIKVGARIYTQTGNYIDTIRNASGCDSIVFTNLTVNIPTARILTAKICQGESFKVGTKTYTQSGTYTDVLTNANNCDSVVTTKLTVIPPLSNSQNLTICQGDFIKIGDKTHNTTGVFKDTLTSSITGCDSVVTTNLTVNPSFLKVQNFNICEGSSVKVGNKTYDKTGVFTDSLKTITGCDSVVTTKVAVFSIFARAIS
jgi:Laminin B (Domain IV)